MSQIIGCEKEKIQSWKRWETSWLTRKCIMHSIMQSWEGGQLSRHRGSQSAPWKEEVVSLQRFLFSVRLETSSSAHPARISLFQCSYLFLLTRLPLKTLEISQEWALAFKYMNTFSYCDAAKLLEKKWKKKNSTLKTRLHVKVQLPVSHSWVLTWRWTASSHHFLQRWVEKIKSVKFHADTKNLAGTQPLCSVHRDLDVHVNGPQKGVNVAES